MRDAAGWSRLADGRAAPIRLGAPLVPDGPGRLLALGAMLAVDPVKRPGAGRVAGRRVVETVASLEEPWNAGVLAPMSSVERARADRRVAAMCWADALEQGIFR
jgi:hypothetical protein